MDSSMRRTIILDHYQNSCNRGRRDGDSSYIKKNSRNVSCIDNIDLYVMIDDGIVRDIKFEGEACVISISTTSIMCDSLRGKTVEEAILIIENYKKMVNEEDYDRNMIGEAVVYDDIGKQPSRKKCALLTWDGILEVLREYEEGEF